MNWTNTFEVAAEPDKVFSTLLDIPTIAPCMPGAQLTGTTDDGAYEGTVKVKLGPITAQYKGRARIVESDRSARRAVMSAEGAETRGQGTAAATITASCTAKGTGTLVEIDTDLKMTGKVAQFGRGVLQDVSSKLIGQFADCLATSVLAGLDSDETEPAPLRERQEVVDLAEVAGPAVAKRLLPIAIGLAILLLLWKVLRSRSRDISTRV